MSRKVNDGLTRSQRYYRRHKAKRHAWMNAYKKRNRELFNSYNSLYWERHPEAKVLARIRTRCGKKERYELIECRITQAEIKQLWDRDNAGSMIQPCIHRKNSANHYTFNNCEFMEYAYHQALHLIEYNKGKGRFNERKWKREICNA